LNGEEEEEDQKKRPLAAIENDMWVEGVWDIENRDEWRFRTRVVEKRSRRRRILY
jgi:hypothetical protein